MRRDMLNDRRNRGVFMLFAPRAATKPTTELLRRIGLSLEAGIDIRKILANEAARTTGSMRSYVLNMSDAVSRGSSLAEAMANTGGYFPRLVRELVGIGWQTGHLPEVLRQLVVHYEQQVALRRTFTSMVAWPMIQLPMSLAVIGFLIWFSGVIRGITGNPIDLLGFGVTGNRGLIVYLVFLGVIFGGMYATYRAILAGKLWTAPIQRFVLRLPLVGGALRTLSVARFAWTLQLTLEAAIDVKRALSLALASTHNVEFTDQEPYIREMITRGQSIHDTLAAAGLFPTEFLQAVQVGEDSGRLVETMSIVAKQQLDAAGRAFAILTRVAGYLIWFAVAAFIIVLIFRLFGTYVNTINQAAGVR